MSTADPTPAARALAYVAAANPDHGSGGAQVVQKARRAPARTPTFDEIGTTGLRHSGGFVIEEWLNHLAGPRGVKAWREMSDNDPVVGAILFAIEMLARGVEWNVEPGSDDRAAKLVESCMHDMSGTWADFVAESFSMLPYGWAMHEIVYKRRLGSDPGTTTTSDGRVVSLPGSRFNDGLIGWRKLPIRAQETLQHWKFSEDGGIEAMVQMAWDGVRRELPMEKALLFRTTTRRNNPEGRSILRNAYVSWFRKKNIEEIEAIGVERDLAGIPMLTAPENLDLYQEVNLKHLQEAQALVTSVRRDEDEGIVKNFGWEFELVTTGGSRQLDTDKIIRRYDQRITTTVLADFILMAQDAVGSYGLGKAKIATFGQAMQAFLGMNAEVKNRYAIPRLLKLNGMSVETPPRLVPGDVDEVDPEQVSAFIQNLHLAGAPIDWNHNLMSFMYKLAGLPEPPEHPADEPLPEPRETEPTDAELAAAAARAEEEANA